MVKEAIQKGAIKTATTQQTGLSEIEQRRQEVISEKEYVKKVEQLETQSEQKYQKTLSELEKQEDAILKAIKENRPLPKVTKSQHDPYYSAFDEQKKYYEAEYNKIKNTTASGRDISELKQQTDKYNIEYYEDGSIQSITARPQSYVDEYTYKKKNGKKDVDEKISNYTPYELSFNPDGTIAKEVVRGVYEKEDDYDKRSSGYRKDRDKEVYTSFFAEYQTGKPVKVQRYGIVKDDYRKDKDGDKKTERSVFLQEESTFDKEGNPLTYKKWDDYDLQDKKTDKYRKQTDDVFLYKEWDSKSGKLKEHSRPTEKKKTVIKEVAVPEPVGKLIVTPSDLFGTAKNVLKAGEYEIKVDKETGKKYTSYAKSTPETIAKLTNLSVTEVKTLQKENPVMLSKVVDDSLEKQLTGKVASEKRFAETVAAQKKALPEVEAKRKTELWEQNIPIAEELISKQEARKELLKSSDTGKVSYVDVKTGQPKPAPLWKQQKSFGEKVFITGETMLSKVRTGKDLVTGKEPKVSPVIKDVFGYNVKSVPSKPYEVVVGGVASFVSATGRTIMGVEQLAKASPFLLEKGQKASTELLYGTFKSDVGVPGYTTPVNPFVKTARGFDKFIETEKKVGAGLVVGAPIVAVAAGKGVLSEYKKAGLTGLAQRVGGEILLGYGVTKAFKFAGKGVSAVATKVDDIRIARVSKKTGEVVTQKTARELSKLKGVGIEVQELTGFEQVKVGARKIGGETLEQETLLLKKAKPSLLDPSDIVSSDFPDVLMLEGRQKFVGAEGYVDEIIGKTSIQRPRQTVIKEGIIDKTIDAVKLKEAIKPSQSSLIGEDYSIKSKIFQTKGGVAVQIEKAGVSSAGQPIVYGEVSKGTIRGLSVPKKSKLSGYLDFVNPFKPKPTSTPQLKTPYGIARVTTPIGEKRIVYTFKGIKPEIVTEVEIYKSAAFGKNVLRDVASKGYAKVGGIEVMSSKFAKGKVTSVSDIIKPTPKDTIVTSGAEQVSILKTETIKEAPRQKTQQKTKAETKTKQESVFGVSKETADRPFIVGDEFATPSAKAFREGVVPKDIYTGKIKPGDKVVPPIIKTIKEPVKEIKISSGIKPADIGFRSDDVSIFDKKVDPIREVDPMIERDIGIDVGIGSDVGVDAGIDSAIDVDSKIEPPVQVQKSIFDRDTVPREPVDDYKPKEPVEEKPIIPKLKFSGGRKKVGGYDVLVKEKGKYIKVNPKQPYEYNSALARMDKALDETPSRSGKVVPSKSKKQPKSDPLAKFNANKYYQKPSGVWVEKSKHAIDTVGEKQGITVKGWMAREQQSRFSSKRKTILVPKKEPKKTSKFLGGKSKSLFNTKSKSMFNTKRGKNGIF